MTTAWSHLPNAAHIDRILTSLGADPDAWGVSQTSERNDALKAASCASRGAQRGAAWAAVKHASWYAAWGADRGADRDAARVAAQDALLALIAWDDCAVFLDMPLDAIRLAAVSGDYPAILLIPAVTSFNIIQEMSK